MNITEVEEGVLCRVKRIQMEEQDCMRLMHVGLYEGATIRIEKKGRKQKPSVILICGNFMMLRYADARRIEVERI